MDYFQYRNEEAWCEEVPLEKIAAEVGTPTFVYSKSTLIRHLEAMKKAFSHWETLPCFAVKSNSNLEVLRIIFSHGFGADIVSIGELKRSLIAGADPRQIVFSGVGKQDFEIKMALEHDILSFNVESSFELRHIAQAAKKMGKIASVSLRVNPNIDAKTNPKIATGMYSSKFGIVETEVRQLVEEIKKSDSLCLVGVSCHIGSQITDLTPLREAARRMAALAKDLLADGHELKHVDMGGGLGITYKDEVAPALDAYAQTLIEEIRDTGLRLLIEPGRVVVGNTGILLSRVIGVKQTAEKNFVVVDGAMNDLLRPSMYDSYHEILAVKNQERVMNCDIVGPICETGDYFGKDRSMPAMDEGDLLYIRACGAYGAVMASNYNSRPRAAEVLVEGGRFQVVRSRESYEQMWSAEL